MGEWGEAEHDFVHIRSAVKALRLKGISHERTEILFVLTITRYLHRSSGHFLKATSLMAEIVGIDLSQGSFLFVSLANSVSAPTQSLLVEFDHQLRPLDVCFYCWNEFLFLLTIGSYDEELFVPSRY